MVAEFMSMAETFVRWLLQPAFHIHGMNSSRAETISFIAGIACDIFLILRKIITWPIGIINNIMLLITCFSVHLYADASLQIVYLLLACWGWHSWLRRIDHSEVRPVGSCSVREWAGILLAFVIGFPIIFILDYSKIQATIAWWDALTTMLSLLAVWLLTTKKWQSWMIWCVTDCIYVPVYAYKDLYLQSILNIFFVLVSVCGVYVWRREYRKCASLYSQ